MIEPDKYTEAAIKEMTVEKLRAKVKESMAWIKDLDNREEHVSKWISVEDRLPDNDDDVLIHPGCNLNDHHIIASYDPWKRKQFIVSYYDGYTTDEFVHWYVTHWMPLPEPPEV